MLDFLADQASWIIAVGVLLAVAGVLRSRWEAISLWLQSTWHSLPGIGGIAWLARRSAHRQGEGAQSEMPAVLTLCGSYARFIRVIDRSDYDNYMNYLRKAGDLGRRPFPPYLWVVIFSMVLVEAGGLAYVLAGWTMPGASEVLQQVTAVGIGFLIAVVLVFFTHWAGVEIYQWNQYRRDRAEWIAAGREDLLFGPDLSLNDPQSIDDHEPAFRQRATRGHGATTCFLTTVTIIMVLAIGVGAAFVRGQVLEQELGHEVADRAKSIARFDFALPDAGKGDAAKLNQRSLVEQQAADQEILIKRRGGWGTLVVLAVIFFFLQLLGMFFGYRYSFNGRLGKDAYRALKADRFSSYSELMQYYDRIADIAQSKLERLQQLIEQQRAGGAGTSWDTPRFSFRDYVKMRDAQRREMPLGGHSHASASHAASFAQAARPAPAAAAQAAPRTYPAAPGAGEKAAATPTIRQQLEEAEALERLRAAERAARGRGKSAPKQNGSPQVPQEVE